VLRGFKGIERWNGGAEEEGLRGRTGFIHVEPSRVKSTVVNAWLEAAVQAGYPRNPDYNGADQYGVSLFQMTINKGYRSSAT
jgi:choline dehydrogenase